MLAIFDRGPFALLTAPYNSREALVTLEGKPLVLDSPYIIDDNRSSTRLEFYIHTAEFTYRNPPKLISLRLTASLSASSDLVLGISAVLL